jgi:hypothetical protein
MIKSHISSTREVKKTTWRLLRKFGILCRKRNVTRSQHKPNQQAILTCAFHLTTFLDSTLSQIPIDRHHKLLLRYLRLLTKFTKELENTLPRARPIPKVLMARLLSLHTKLFNLLIHSGVIIRVDLDDWSNIILTAVMIWGNNL